VVSGKIVLRLSRGKKLTAALALWLSHFV